jgi:hypothetical protein
MSENTPGASSARRRIWTVLETVSAVSALGFFLYYMYLGEQLTHTSPTEANPSTGRIFPLNNHDYVVYLTSSQKHHLHVLVWAAGFLFLLAVFIGVFIKKSWRRRKPWEAQP